MTASRCKRGDPVVLNEKRAYLTDLDNDRPAKFRRRRACLSSGLTMGQGARRHLVEHGGVAERHERDVPIVAKPIKN